MSALSLARQLMLTLHNDLPTLLRIDNYLHGKHDAPYTPDSAGSEFRMLRRRSTTSLMSLVIDSASQSLYVDSVRPGRKVEPLPDGTRPKLPEWTHWQVSRLDSRQVSIHREALAYGHAFTVTERRGERVQTKGLSALTTTAIFEDAGNDETPIAAFSVTEWPSAANGMTGTASMWDETREYEVLFTSLGDVSEGAVVVSEIGLHGSAFCPVTRFACRVDLTGRTTGLIEPLIVLQDRINQTVFDMLVVQSGAAFKTRWATGMAPPYKMTYEVGQDGVPRAVPVTDAAGNPVIADVEINAMRFLHAEDKDTKFGTLDESPLAPYLAAIEDCFKTLASIAHVPPFFLLGGVVNLSAEAMQAAMTSQERQAGEFRNVFGESWERVFRLAAELDGVTGAVDDYDTECIWRDTNARALAPVADGLLKLVQAGAPIEGVLALMPGMTKNMLEEWLRLIEEQKEEQAEADAQLAQAQSLIRNRNATSVAQRQQAAAGSPASQAGADKVP